MQKKQNERPLLPLRLKNCLPLFLAAALSVGILTGCQRGAAGGDDTKDTSRSQVTTIAAGSGEEGNKGDTITLTDSVGREITLPHPVRRAVVVDRYNNEMIRACGADQYVVAVDTNTAQDRQYWAQFDPDTVVGEGCTNYNYEKVIDVDPDLFIISDISPYEETTKKLEPFDIPNYALIAYVPSRFEENVKNVGKIFGVEEQADKFFNYFNDKLEYIKKEIKPDQKQSVYLETTKSLKAALPGSGYNEMIEYAGAENIMATDFEAYKETEIDPEEVLHRNPDIIVKLVTPKSAIAGSGIYTPPTKEDFQEAYNEIISRPGWSDMDAVKNNRIYFMSQFGQGGAGKLVGTLYIAKWLYPDQLPELDPDQAFRDWMETFQKFEYVPGHFYSAEELK